MLRSLVTFALLVPLALAPDVSAATPAAGSHSAAPTLDGKKKKSKRRHHRKHRKARKHRKNHNGKTPGGGTGGK